MKNGFDSKERILERMQKDASSIYEQYTNRRLDNQLGGFDPLVYMLLGACASEFEKVSQEINTSWTRMLKNIAALLTPEVHTGPKPAHAILHAKAFEKDAFSKINNQVYLNYKEKDLFFSPSGEFQLFPGDINYLATGDTLYFIEENQSKLEFAKTRSGKRLQPYCCWLGLDLDEGIRDINGLRFYLDFKAESMRRQTGALLDSSVWRIGEQVLDMKVGLQDKRKVGKDPVAEVFQIQRTYEQEVNAYYDQQFIEIKGSSSDIKLERKLHPEAFLQTFSEASLSNLKEELIWIKVEFSPAFFPKNEEAEDILDRCLCQINCFPVINRKRHENTYRLNEFVNLFPLETHAYFLAVEGVVSSHLKHAYQEKPFLQLDRELKPEDENSMRTYTLRREGVNRFDRRDASAVINNLLRFFREEILVFSALGKDVVSNNVKTISKALNDLENKIAKGANDSNALSLEPTVYIAFPPGKRENVMIQYWSTDGFFANRIPAHLQLNLHDDSQFDNASLYFITPSIGARDPLGDTDSLHEFKSALLTRNRIVTHADIKAVCMHHLGDEINDIRIEKGIEVSPSRKKGLIRTIRVILDPFDPTSVENRASFWTHHLQKLEVLLNAQSVNLCPIRVEIDRHG